ncbi:MAG: hypothetical protein IIC29_07795 [Chloroflexi bacterium]|nr:hypothetical protein [Chloroflexota bacterium]
MRFLEAPGDAGRGGWAIALGRFRQAVTARIRAGLDGEAGAVAAALLTGQRGAIPKRTLAAMRDAGLTEGVPISLEH